MYCRDTLFNNDSIKFNILKQEYSSKKLVHDNQISFFDSYDTDLSNSHNILLPKAKLPSISDKISSLYGQF